VVLAVALDHWRARLRYWDEVVVMLAVGLFLHFYPILSAAPLAGPGAFARWIWLDSWA
jgi:hypothetical protein